MLASIPSATVLGVRGSPVTVEVFVGDGLPGYHMVGMPDTACRESRDRVRAAISSAGFGWPNRCITVNLAPTTQRKTGAGLDVAIAIGVLVASEQLSGDVVHRHAFIGELGFDGTIRRVPGVAPMVDALDDGAVVVPAGNVVEAQIAARGPVLRGSRPRHRGGLSVGDPNLGPARSGRQCRRTAAASRPQRRSRPAGRPPGAGDRRRRRPPPPARRIARERQDDAGAAARRSAPATRPGPGVGDHDGALGGWSAPCPPAGWYANHRSGRRTTPHQSSDWSVEDPTN